MSEDKKKEFDRIFRRAVEWMANCPEGEVREVQKGASLVHIMLYVSRYKFITQNIKHYDLMLLMDGGFALNNGNGEYAPCADPIGAFDAFVDYCNNEFNEE